MTKDELKKLDQIEGNIKLVMLSIEESASDVIWLHGCGAVHETAWERLDDTLIILSELREELKALERLAYHKPGLSYQTLFTHSLDMAQPPTTNHGGGDD